MQNLFRILSLIILVVILISAAHADNNTQPVLYGQEQLTALLDNLDSDIQPGTAGCSLRATARAAELLKWGENTELSVEEIQTVVKAIVSHIPEERNGDFAEALEDVRDAVERIVKNPDPEMLREAGIDPDEYDFTELKHLEAVEAVFTAYTDH